LTLGSVEKLEKQLGESGFYGQDKWAVEIGTLRGQKRVPVEQIKKAKEDTEFYPPEKRHV